jgi:hypothetical protein
VIDRVAAKLFQFFPSCCSLSQIGARDLAEAPFNSFPVAAREEDQGGRV